MQIKYIFIALFLLFNQPAFSYEKIELEIDSGTVFSMSQFPADGDKLLIWLPSEHGFSARLIPTALDIALHDYDVWTVNLHETYMIPVGRNSINEVDVTDVVSLIDHAQQQGFKEVYFLSSGRGAQLALKAAYQWQQQNKNHSLLRGMMFFSPHLIKGSTDIGNQAEYVEIASLSNLPIYILQEQYSTKYARIKEISEQLQKGGSPVYIEPLKGIRGGFYMRPDEDLTAKDLEMRGKLPGKISRAIKLLSKSSTGQLVETSDSGIQEMTPAATTIKLPELNAYKGNKQPAAFDLPVKNGDRFNLADLKGSVVLINFWATWCKPCVDEIPSLSRLQSLFKGAPFKIVAVNIGEPEAVIDEFVKKVPVDFDILLDREGKAVRDWKVYAYPSNFVIDKNGLIQYAYRGALEWDSEPIVDTIKELLN